MSTHLKLIGVLNVGRVHTLKNQAALEVIACINKAHFIRCESQRTRRFSRLGLGNHRGLQPGSVLNIQCIQMNGVCNETAAFNLYTAQRQGVGRLNICRSRAPREQQVVGIPNGCVATDIQIKCTTEIVFRIVQIDTTTIHRGA